MGATFTDHVRVRAYECDAFGHVNDAVYLQYLEQVTLDAMGAVNDGDAFWNVRRLSIEYQTPARYGDVLQTVTWVLDADELHVVRGYDITRGAGMPVVLAEIDWDYRDRASQAPRPVPEEHRAVPSARVPAPLKPYTTPGDNGSQPFRWRHPVRFYEVDATSRIALAAYFNWMQAAVFRAASLVGWPLEAMRANNFVTLQYRHDAEFFGTASNDNEVEIVSRLIEVRRVRGTWLHEVYNAATTTLIMRDYSTGTFLDWDGNVRAGPADMMEALMRGEPRARAIR